jgi:hypothetical protein
VNVGQLDPFLCSCIIRLITSFFPPLRFFGLFVPIIVVVLILVVYSYILYQRYTVEGKEPLSPPFNGRDGTDIPD